MLDAKLLKPRSLINVNGDSLPSPLIIGTFEKCAPGHLNTPCSGFQRQMEIIHGCFFL